MKRASVILGMALTLCTSTVNVRAHGGCYGGGWCGFWPFWPLAFGAGIALGSVATAHSYSYPTYVYAPPAYVYSYPQPAHAYSAAAPVQHVQPAASSPSVSAPVLASTWVPSSPGVGHWVQDPTPYSYNPNVGNRAVVTLPESTAQSVTVSKSVGNVPVYAVVR